MSVARNLISPALLHLSCRCSSASSSSSGSSGSSSTPSSPSIRNASAQASISRRDAVKAVIKKVEESKEVGPFFDTFGRVHNYLRLSLTEKCSLRCVYCMPEEGIDLTPRSQLLTTDEIIKLVEVFAKNGIDKVRLTGGEPTNRKDLETIVERINGVKGINSIGITSNGVILHRNLENLKKAGLTKVNISLDTLDPAKYLLMTRRKVLPSVLKSIAKAEELYPMVKLNNVVMRNWNENEILHFIELTKERRLDVRFIEYMPFGGNDFSSKKFVGYAEMMKKIKGVYGEDVIRLQDSAHDTTKAWKIKGYTGQFGFITSMSEHFCDTCNRLRITADGNLKVCLHGNAEVSMRDLLRQGASDEEIQDVVRAAVLRKKKQHAGPSSFSNKLSHVSSDGSAKQVDVSHKKITHRVAVAEGYIRLTPEILHQIKHNLSKKGDVLNVAKIAAIMGSKQTSNLIPLCHNVPINVVHCQFELMESDCRLKIVCTAKTDAATGIEMEALTACSIAALTVYDMCKAVSSEMVIESIRLVSKTGGKSDDFYHP